MMCGRSQPRAHGSPPGPGAGDGRGLCAPYTPPLESVTSQSTAHGWISDPELERVTRKIQAIGVTSG